MTIQAPFRSSSRRGWPLMTSKMLAVLTFLRQAKADGWPYVPLEAADYRTLRALCERDWIFKSAGEVDVRYGLTDRGERALKVYEPVVRRHDGICPTCGERPRHIRKSGILNAYCLECDNASKRKAYRLKRPKIKAGRMCSRCGKRPVHIQSGGRAITYCLRCKNLRNRHRKKKDRKRDVRLAQQGQVKLCARPGCTRPRHVSPSGVLDWCREHYREWHNEYRHRKAKDRVPGKIGRPRKVQVQP